MPTRAPRAITPVYLARKRMKLTQKQIAEEVGITIRTYRYIEAWERVPSVIKGMRIARLLGADVWDLWGDLEAEGFK